MNADPARRPVSRPLRAAAAGALAALLAACNVIPAPQADPTRYFVLGEAADAGSAPDHAPVATGARLGLRVRLGPAYLEGRAIVVRRGPNEIAPQEFSRWGDPLDAALQRRITTRLARAAGVARVLQPPFPLDPESRIVDVTVEIVRCEGVLLPDGTGTSSLEAVIELAEPGGLGRVIARRGYSAPAVSWDGHDFGALARALGTQADGLAAAVAAMLPDVPPAPAADPVSPRP